MLVIVSNSPSKNKKVYHKPGCKYERRISPENKWVISSTYAKCTGYRECRYCAGLHGDIRVHKTAFKSWEKKKHIKFTYKKEANALYIQTKIGFWKLFINENAEKYILYHRNTFSQDLSLKQAINGSFHRQNDVIGTSSIEKIVNYVTEHDKAKEIIADDYRKLPQRTKRQKKYYKSAQRKEKRNAISRIDALFASLESSQADLIQYSFC